MTKDMPANSGEVSDVGLILGWEDPLEEDIATHSSILAWKIPWTEESGCVHYTQSVVSQRVEHE